MVVGPVNRQKLSSQIFIELQKYFVKEKLKPGDRLPSERTLASTLCVSRNSLREALRVLEILGLIEVVPGSGTYVKKMNDNSILPLAMALSVENNSIKEIMEVRLILECSGVKLAAERRDEEDLLHIESTLAEMRASIHDINSWLKADLRFHYCVVKAANNSLLLRLYYTIVDSLTKTMDIAAQNRFVSEKKFLDTLDEHILIYEYLKNKDVSMAQEKMFQHLSGVIEDVI